MWSIMISGVWTIAFSAYSSFTASSTSSTRFTSSFRQRSKTEGSLSLSKLYNQRVVPILFPNKTAKLVQKGTQTVKPIVAIDNINQQIIQLLIIISCFGDSTRNKGLTKKKKDHIALNIWKPQDSIEEDRGKKHKFFLTATKLLLWYLELQPCLL